jgi:hypothetical protein
MTAAELVLDHLETLVSDWRTHLRARNRSRAIIASYERSAIALRAFLVSRGMPTSVAAIARGHVTCRPRDRATVLRQDHLMQDLSRMAISGLIARARLRSLPEQLLQLTAPVADPSLMATMLA